MPEVENHHWFALFNSLIRIVIKLLLQVLRHSQKAIAPITWFGSLRAVDVCLTVCCQCYIKTNATLECVGLNNYGQLGDGMTTRSRYPVSLMKRYAVSRSPSSSVSQTCVDACQCLLNLCRGVVRSVHVQRDSSERLDRRASGQRDGGVGRRRQHMRAADADVDDAFCRRW